MLEIRKSILGRPSYYYAVGFVTCLYVLPLLYTVITPIYFQISSLIKATPLSSILAASPGVFILGILVDQARVILKKYIFKAKNYRTNKLPKISRGAIKQSISEVLNIPKEEVDLKSDKHLEEARLVALPLFDQYTIAYRWINDFLESTILISVFSLTVISFRAVGNSFRGLELSLLEVWLVVILVSSVSIIGLPKKYTIAETSIFLVESNRMTKT